MGGLLLVPALVFLIPWASAWLLAGKSARREGAGIVLFGVGATGVILVGMALWAVVFVLPSTWGYIDPGTDCSGIWMAVLLALWAVWLGAVAGMTFGLRAFGARTGAGLFSTGFGALTACFLIRNGDMAPVRDGAPAPVTPNFDTTLTVCALALAAWGVSMLVSARRPRRADGVPP